MLSTYNEKLSALREKIARCGKHEAMLRDLRAQEKELCARVAELAAELQMGKADVDRLTGGFWSIYYAVIGKKEEMLEKERAEALKVSMKYETAKKELGAVQNEIFRVDWEAGSVRQLQREYDQVLREKTEAMKQMTAYAEKIAGIEEEKEYLSLQLQEVNEAMEAGRRVLGQIDTIADSLDSAEDWGTWDLFSGGIMADIAKYSHLDDAQEGVGRLEALLRAFRTELADITIHSDVSVPSEGFTRFADWFFDGLFVDWTVLSRIQESKSSLRTVRQQVERVMDQLRKMERDMKHKIDDNDFNIRSLAEEA